MTQAWLFDPIVSVPPRRRALPRRLALCVLGSGSGGNASVVLHRGRALFIDLGLRPATLTRRLHQAGLTLDDAAGACLTHLDQDHFQPAWLPILHSLRLPIYLHRWHVESLRALRESGPIFEAGRVVPVDHPFEPLPGLHARTVRLRHDTQGTTGYHLCTAPWRGGIGYATDLGHVPPELIETFTGVDILAIEANYDPQMQAGSSRPWFLKRRIMGEAGHLSNEQAFDAVRQLTDRSPPRRVVLLHRSAQCNDPAIIKRLFAQDPRLAGRVVLSEQRRRSAWALVAGASVAGHAPVAQMDLFTAPPPRRA